MRLLQEAPAAAEGLQTSIVSDVLLPLSLALIMLGMGLGLTMGHFRELVRQPRAALGALGAQLLLLPTAAALVVWLWMEGFGLELELGLGLLLLAAVPGGATSNMLTYLARGDIALSVALTAFTSIFSFLLAPASFWVTTTLLFGDATVIDVSLIEVLKLTLAVVAGPVLIGMGLGRMFPGLLAKVDKPLRIFSIVLLFVLIAGIIAQNGENFWAFARDTIPAAAALNVLAIGAGFGVALVLKLKAPQMRSTVIEVGFQNGTFAILLAISQLDSARAALMPGFYSLFMFLTGGALVVLWGRAGRSEPSEARPAAAE